MYTHWADKEKTEALVKGYLFTIAELRHEVEYLKKKLTEADRTSTFYRYHKGAKS